MGNYYSLRRRYYTVLQGFIYGGDHSLVTGLTAGQNLAGHIIT